MDDDLDQVLALKASAKSARDDDDWEEAISDLEEAVDFVRTLAASSAPHSRLDAEFADLFGLIGGVEKRWALSLDGRDRREHLAASVAAYDAGFGYERNLQPNDANTYNRVNRLIGRVLLDPQVLEKGAADSAEVADGLEKAEKIVTEEIQSARQKDPWAYCDLGTIQLLRGMPDALSTFQQLDRLRPPAFVYESMLATLEMLCEVASDLRPDLVQAVDQLRQYARRGR